MSNTQPPPSALHPALPYFRILAQEHAHMPDEEVTTWLTITEPDVSRSFFGSKYFQALALLAAHRIIMANKARAESAGEYPVASLSEDGGSISFRHDTPNVADEDSIYTLTTHGQEFLRIKNRRPLGPVL